MGFPVHPRVCRERVTASDFGATCGGSSPRVQGTLIVRQRVARRERFIPACAGNARAVHIEATRLSVHPRVCRERLPGANCLYFEIGSSPRVQGTRVSNGGPASRRRFIPACAGNAFPGLHVGPLLPVHPRVCRERITGHGADTGTHGSSPRVQGTRVDLDSDMLLLRFIPACAGNAGVGLSSKFWEAVHPRVCRERWSASVFAAALSGSSPRVQGTQYRRPAAASILRFIPACAGNAAG